MRTRQYIKEINKFSEELNETNKEKFDEILVKIRYSDINNHDAEEFSHHCLDLFLLAEKEKISVEEVIGNDDLELFCEEFIRETRNGYSKWMKIYWKVSLIPLVVFIFTGIYEMLVGYLIKGWVNKTAVLTVPVTLSMLINSLIAIGITYLILSKIPALIKPTDKKNKKEERKEMFLQWLFLWLFFSCITGIFVMSKLFLTIALFEVNYIVFMGVLGIILIAQNYFENKV